MDSDFWSLEAFGGFEWRVEVTPDFTLRKPDGDCYTDADEDAFGKTWCYADLKVTLVHTSNEEVQWDAYLGAVEWGEMPGVSITREMLNAQQVMELKMEIWGQVEPMFQDIRDGAYQAFDSEIEAYIVKRQPGYKAIKPLDLMRGMQVGIYEEELAFATNLSAKDEWYKTRLAVFLAATPAVDDKVEVRLSVDGKSYFFVVPAEHEFKVYKED